MGGRKVREWREARGKEHGGSEGRWGRRDTVASVAGSAAQQAPTARYGLAQSRAKGWGVGSSTVARSLSLF